VIFDGVVADANVLLSAVLGKAALRIFSEYKIPVHTTLFNTEEVEEYLPRLASKYGVLLETLQLQWKLLPVRIHAYAEYAHRFEESRSIMDLRDSDDAHLLALSLALGLPLWSNDRDFEDVGVECLSTARLLKALE
jgi:predicted nucleic acid-binding protein